MDGGGGAGGAVVWALDPSGGRCKTRAGMRLGRWRAAQAACRLLVCAATHQTAAARQGWVRKWAWDGGGLGAERNMQCRRLSSLVGRVRTRQLGEASTAPKAKGAPQTSPMNCFVRHHSQNIHDTPYMPAVLLATTCTPLPLCHYCHYRDPDNHTRRFARIFSPAFRAFCCYLPYHGP